jgi:hypothetical protein
MNRLLFLLLLAAPLAQAQIYRCDGDQGPVYSDKPCGEQAEVVTVQDSSSGISPGPSDDVKDYLASKREERANDRAQQQAAPNNPAQPPLVVTEGQNYGYPVYWPGNGNRPVRPKPQPPIQPPPDLEPGGSVLRPRGGR